MNLKPKLLALVLLPTGAAAESDLLLKVGLMCGSKPGSLGLMQKDHAVLAIDGASEPTVVKPHYRSKLHLSFRGYKDRANIWASGTVDADTGMPFVWLSKQLESEYFSLEYFNSCSASVLIQGVPDNFVIFIPDLSKSMTSCLFVPIGVDSGQTGARFTAGSYLTLLCDIDAADEGSNNPVITIIDQRRFEVTDEDALENQDSPEEPIVRLAWNKMERSKLSPQEIERATPWIRMTDEEGMIFSLNKPLVDSFRSVE